MNMINDACDKAGNVNYKNDECDKEGNVNYNNIYSVNFLLNLVRVNTWQHCR